MALIVVRWSLKALFFLSLSRMIDINDFVYRLFWNFFRLQHDVLLLEIFYHTTSI